MKYSRAVVSLALLTVSLYASQIHTWLWPVPPAIAVQAITPRQIEYGIAQQEAAKVLKIHGCSTEYAGPVGRAAVDQRISPRLLAALVFVESSCRANAISNEGAVGLTQINVRVWRVSRKQALDPDFNLKLGTKILADYVRAHGIREGLHRYNGLGDDGSYSDRVLEAAYRP